MPSGQQASLSDRARKNVTGRSGSSWKRKEAFLEQTKGAAPVAFLGPRPRPPCPAPGLPAPPPPLPRGGETSAHRRSRAGTQPPKALVEAPPLEQRPRPRARAWGRSRRQASAIYPERRRRRTLAGTDTLAERSGRASERRRLAAAAAREEGWRRPRRGFTGWSTLRAGAPLARNAARVSPRTRSAWPSWCRCGGARPGRAGGAGRRGHRGCLGSGPPRSPCGSL